MTETNRDALKGTIATNLPDNTSGKISPADIRNEFINLVDSVPFKFTSSAIPPGADDDISDTAGNGSFGIGDLWTDSASGIIYICADNTAAAAVWQIAATNFAVIGDGDATTNQIAIWQDDSTVVGTSALTYEAGVLNVTGTVAATDFTGDGSALTGVASTAQGALADTALQTADIGVAIQAYAVILDNTTASFTTADETKLDGIEALADFTGDGSTLTGVASTAQGALADTALQTADIGVAIQAYAVILDNTTASFTTADETKLDGIEALADFTGDGSTLTGVASTAQGALADTSVQATSATGQANLPSGTTAQRTTPAGSGDLRFNSTEGSFEGHNGTDWGSIGGGAAAGIFYENDQTVTINYTLVATKNAMTAGPIHINSGVTVTIETGARWVVL